MFEQEGKNDVARLKYENERLRKSVEELSTLNELTSVISSTMSLNKILDKVVSSSVKAIFAEQGTIHLVDKDAEPLDPFKTLIRKADVTTPQDKFRLDVELSGWMLRNRQPLVINDFENNRYFVNREAGNLKIKTLLTVPLVAKGKLIGVLNLFNKKKAEGFTEEDQRLLAIIGSQSAQVIENARLYEQEKHLIEIEKELDMARTIQQKMLPKEAPNVPGFDIAGASYAAKDVGGDYFDFIRVADDRWFLTLGDVSGKGVPAALLMSHLQATIRNQALTNSDVVSLISNSNEVLHRNTEGNKFVTLFGGFLDPTKRVFDYVNAGHNFPHHHKQGNKILALKEGGLVLGMMPGVPYEAGQTTFESGDVLVIYSDGVTEAENLEEDMFGDERLQELVQKHREKSAADLVQTVYKTVKKFEGNKEQDDDITVVVIKAD